MAIMKCKMCGGDLSITEGNAVTECEYCGTLQTVPNGDSYKDHFCPVDKSGLLLELLAGLEPAAC